MTRQRASGDAADWRSEIVRRLSSVLQTLEPEESARDFFAARVQQQVEQVVDLAECAIREGRLELRDGHSGSELVLDTAFNGDGKSVFRGVHYLSDTDFMSSFVVRAWSDRVQQLLSQGRIVAVRRLIVYGNPSDLESMVSRRFLAGQLHAPGHEIREISQVAMRDVLRHLDVAVPHDLGIYADRYAFVSSTSDPSSLAGTWFRGAREVRMLLDAFDECWYQAARAVHEEDP